jgi:hypothetical protein
MVDELTNSIPRAMENLTPSADLSIAGNYNVNNGYNNNDVTIQQGMEKGCGCGGHDKERRVSSFSQESSYVYALGRVGFRFPDILSFQCSN